MRHAYPYRIKCHGNTLERCEDEPVQTPGCIQAHGVLLVLRRSDLTVLQVSEETRGWLGAAPEALLAAHVSVALGEAVAEDIRTALGRERLEYVSLYVADSSPTASRSTRPRVQSAVVVSAWMSLSSSTVTTVPARRTRLLPMPSCSAWPTSASAICGSASR